MWGLFYDVRSMLQYLILHVEQLPHNCLYQRQCRYQWPLSPTGPYSRSDTSPYRRAAYWSSYAGHFKAYEGHRRARKDLRRIWWGFWWRQLQFFEPEGLWNEGTERAIRTCTFRWPSWSSYIATDYNGEIVRRGYSDGETLSICCFNRVFNRVKCYHLRQTALKYILFLRTYGASGTVYQNESTRPLWDFADRWIMGGFYIFILGICLSL